MEIPLQLPTTIYGWIAIAATIVAAAVWIRQQKIKSIIEANDELRKRLDDKDNEIVDLNKKIDDQNKTIDDQNKTIAGMQEEIKAVQRSSKTMQDLVVSALKQFFLEHPEVAKSMEDMVKGGN